MPFFNNSKLFVMLALVVPALLLAAACSPSSPAGSSEPAASVETEAAEMPDESAVAVSFANDRMTPETIQVEQGDNVTLNLKTDRPGSFHIHGYDLEQEAIVGAVTRFQFVANATGRFRINFHGASETEHGMAQAGGIEPAKGAHHSSGGIDHGPVESSMPVSLEISAAVAENGGIHVAVDTEGWRWAPEEVNRANRDGAGHAHIYADGVKLSRVYGSYHYLPTLEPGTREIQVFLNSNDHSELTWQGTKLESTVSVTVPEMSSMGHADNGVMMDVGEAEAPMSLEAVVHEDALGGYNLQIIPSGFEFSQSAGRGHEPGKGYAQLSINGEVFNRLYVPWLQVPAQGAGMHTFTVALLNNEGHPYRHNGQPVESSVTVHEKAQVEDGDGAMADHRHHHRGDATAGAEELEVGYLEVLP
jgi:hypothetical protein